MTADLGILGGGLMGLALAHLELARGRRVTIYERDAVAGGLLRAASLDGVRFDRFYHCVLPTDHDLLWLLDDLGAGDRIAWRRTRTGFFHRGALHSLDGMVDFLRFPLLTPAQRLRLGWTIFRTSRIKTWEEVDRLPVEDYLVRLGGRAVFERVWRPLLRAKLGEAYTHTSAAFIWSTINRLYSARATPDRAEKMGFLRGSYEPIVDLLLDRIRARGGEIRLGCAVRSLECDERGVTVVTADDRRSHDSVVSTIPPPALANLVRPLDERLARSLTQFRFHGVRTHVLLLRRPFTPYYVLNLTDMDSPVTGLVEMGNLAPADYFGEGRSFLYLPRYAPTDSDDYLMDDDRFREGCLEYLRRIRPGFSDDDVVGEAAFQAPSVLPIPTLGFGETVPPFRTSLPGLFFAHNLQVYPQPLHNDAVVGVARRLSRELEKAAPVDTRRRGIG